MAKAAEHEELKDAFQTHLEETEEHVRRAWQLLNEKLAELSDKGRADVSGDD